MSARFRILHCLRAPSGGLGRHVRDLVEGQAEMGAEIGVILDARATGKETDAALGQLAEHCALGVSRVPMTGRMGFADWLTEARIAKLAAERDVHVLHGHGPEGGAYARLAGQRLKRKGKRVKIVYTPHGGLERSPASPLGRFMRMAERRLAPFADGLIFESRAARDLYAEAIGRPLCPVRVVPNGLHRHEIYETLLEDNAADFAFIGEPSKAKGIDVFLAALAEHQTIFRSTAIVVGAGPEDARAKRLAQKLGLRSRVSFSKAQAARTAFARARCVVAPARGETFPYILLEAAAARMPLIASDVGSVREIVGEVGMKLVPPGDVEALASQMRVFLAEPQPFLARAAKLQARVAERFTVEAMTRAVVDFYVTELGAGSYATAKREAVAAS